MEIVGRIEANQELFQRKYAKKMAAEDEYYNNRYKLKPKNTSSWEAQFQDERNEKQQMKRFWYHFSGKEQSLRKVMVGAGVAIATTVHLRWSILYMPGI